MEMVTTSSTLRVPLGRPHAIGREGRLSGYHVRNGVEAMSTTHGPGPLDHMPLDAGDEEPHAGYMVTSPRRSGKYQKWHPCNCHKAATTPEHAGMLWDIVHATPSIANNYTCIGGFRGPKDNLVADMVNNISGSGTRGQCGRR